MSTQIQRWSSGSNITSELMLSQLPSKARPIRLPFASSTGEPELPPVMSLLVRKQVCSVPSASAQRP